MACEKKLLRVRLITIDCVQAYPVTRILSCLRLSVHLKMIEDKQDRQDRRHAPPTSVVCYRTSVSAGFSSALMPHSRQSSPNSSTGCCVRSVPFPQTRESAGQYLSHPQQMRSGFFGCVGNFFVIAVLLILKAAERLSAGKVLRPHEAKGVTLCLTLGCMSIRQNAVV